MKVKLPKGLWKVTITEYDRFRGAEELSVDFYDNETEAIKAAMKINSKNTSQYVPECYIAAAVLKVKVADAGEGA